MRKFISSDLFFYFTLIILIVMIGQLPVILHIFHTPKGYYYPYLDTVSSAGDFYYQALIRYGTGTEWLVRIPYINGAYQSSFIQIIFLWLGKISLITGIGPAEIYAISRISGGLIYVSSAVFLFKTILSRTLARMAFIFFLFAEPLAIPVSGNVFNQDFGKWTWFFEEAARRITLMPPHYTLGKGMALFSLVFLINFLKSRKISDLLWSLVLIFTAGIIYPPPVFIILVSLALSGLMDFITHKEKYSKCMSGYIYPAIYGFIASIPLLLLKIELNKGYPWNMWSKVELGWNSPGMNFELEYFTTIGLMVFLVPLSFIYWRKMKSFNRSGYLIPVWGLSAYILFPLANIIQVGKFRLTEGAQIVPLAILSVYGVVNLKKLIEEKINSNLGKIIAITAVSAYTIYFIIFSSLTAISYTNKLWGYWINIYFRPQEIAGLSYLRQNVPPDSLILSGIHTSSFIPAFARVKTMIGFSDLYENFSDFEKDRETIDLILEEKLTENETQAYLLSKHADYLYKQKLSPEEEKLYPSLLENVFQNEIVSIYKVKK